MNDSPLLKRAYMLWTLAYGQYNRTDSKIEAALKEWRSGLKTREEKEEIALLEREAAEKERKKKEDRALFEAIGKERDLERSATPPIQ